MHQLYVFMRWALGFPPASSGTNSSGFDTESLLPERPRTAGERGVALATSLLVLWVFIGSFVDVPSPAIDLGVILSIGGMAWGALMILPLKIPMDRTAIALGGYTLAPWLVNFVFGGPSAKQGVTTDFILWFWGHLAGVIVLVAVGLILEVRREMQAKDHDR